MVEIENNSEKFNRKLFIEGQPSFSNLSKKELDILLMDFESQIKEYYLQLELKNNEPP